MGMTSKQELGSLGETLVAKTCMCPKCKRKNTFKCLPQNFKCADIICDFCGYLAQVKSKNVEDVNQVPDAILGAAWGPQEERMRLGIYFALFLVLISEKEKAIYFLSSDFQKHEVFRPRNPLSKNARRAGWQGFVYNLQPVRNLIARLF